MPFHRFCHVLAQMPSLIWAFPGHTCHFVGFVLRWIIYLISPHIFWVIIRSTSNEYPQHMFLCRNKKNSNTFRLNQRTNGPVAHLSFWLIVLGFNDTSTLEGHFVSSPREREKRDRRESRGDEREGQGRKRNRNESEETEEIKTFPLYPYPLQG